MYDKHRRCLDVNADNYNADATVQGLDQYGNIACNTVLVTTFQMQKVLLCCKLLSIP